MFTMSLVLCNVIGVLPHPGSIPFSDSFVVLPVMIYYYLVWFGNIIWYLFQTSLYSSNPCRLIWLVVVAELSIHTVVAIV